MNNDPHPAGKSELGPHASVLAPGTILQSRYRIVRQLGKGGMGAVYEAVDERLDATVALKETFSVDERLRRQFEQEARLLAQLSHPALPRVSDYFTKGERAFLVMQFISGVDLAEIIAQQPGPFPRNQVVAWADQLLDALIFLHTRERQILHRDIKPHNIKLTPNGTIALLDFGLAKTEAVDRAGADPSDSIFGYTRRYAPLEQIQDQGTTPQSDIYALGATLYHLLTGIKPVDALVREAALGSSMPDPLRPANEIHGSVGPELAAVLKRAMAQKAEDRYPTATAFREALARVGRSEDAVREPVPQTPSTKSPEVPSGVAQPIAKTERVRAGDPFDSYSILKPEEPEWFVIRPTRGPNKVVAGILVLLLAGLVGALYGFRYWADTPASKSTKTRPGQSVTAPTVPGSRLRLNANAMNLSPVPLIELTKPIVNADRREPDSKTDTKVRPQFRLEGGNLSAAAITRFDPPQRGSQTETTVNVPNARLPRTDLKESDPAPSIQRLPAYGQPEVVYERQVLRSPDGTQVVKFSDGTTKVFRPGEKNVHPGMGP